MNARLRAALPSVLAILLVHCAQAQTVPITLDDLLLRLEENLKYYDANVPSFFCDEHSISKVSAGTSTSNSIAESTFRLKRERHPDGSESLVESREVKVINGRPAHGEELTGPSTLSGAFSGGVAIVSLRQGACMHYTLRPLDPDHPDYPYIVEFTAVPKGQRPEHCVIQEEGSGRVYVDPSTMQVTHVEFRAPNHIIVPESQTNSGRTIAAITGPWKVTVEYGEVSLGGDEFWLPATITGIVTGGRGPTTWSFEAHYSNFHKLDVKSRVLPVEPQPQPPAQIRSPE